MDYEIRKLKKRNQNGKDKFKREIPKTKFQKE
jgi:hypothetical protein